MTSQQPKFIFRRGTYSGPSSRSSGNCNGSAAVYTFNQTRPTNSVSVEGVPECVDTREVVALFNTIIGEVRSFQEFKDGHYQRLDITFNDRDTATKALCMNGYTVEDSRIVVSALTISSPAPRSTRLLGDDRRNLYVLGLPFALTKNEFAALFAPYGNVSHCVILATVDNSSRRRGFVVMSSHEEAKVAMTALTRSQVKGHVIDVSWAVVQRSQGFLDGGDRSLILDSRPQMMFPSPRISESPSLASSDTSDSSQNSLDADKGTLAMVSVPTNALLVENLPTLLFSQAQDLHPLFYPFGHIEKLEIVHVSPMGSMAVVVCYSTTSAAQEARTSLSGQFYGNFQLETQFVGPTGYTSPAPLIRRPPALGRRMTDPSPWTSNSFGLLQRGDTSTYSSFHSGSSNSHKFDLMGQQYHGFSPALQSGSTIIDDPLPQRPLSTVRWPLGPSPSCLESFADSSRAFTASFNPAAPESLPQSTAA